MARLGVACHRTRHQERQPLVWRFRPAHRRACENVYWADVAPYGNSNFSYLWRFSPDTMVAEHIKTLDSGYVSNIRFGSGVGGWEQGLHQ